MRYPLEIWGGLECSVVRVGNTVRNQLRETGYTIRRDDLQLIASTGIKALRYPVLWEEIEPVEGQRNWERSDADLRILRDAGIRPIAGLVHHGSGPLWTDVLDPGFPHHLALHARAVAERYPWIEMFTPINEPLTTARISGLYGLWHPHSSDEATFLQLVVAQCKAVAAAMRAIRALNPAAKLVQTEDLGRVFATPKLSYQAEFENERRWLAMDLLAGRVDRGHPFFQRLLDHGIEPSDLVGLRDEPCPPDIIGLDYYLTSDRFLDERLELYPGEPPGGNGRDVYVDVAAVRAHVPEQMLGVLPRIMEIWDRYELPISITEQHNGCTRDEQLRWLIEGWRAAETARRLGADVRSVTCWSMLGALDWNSMLARQEGYYEPGAFDIRYSPPRPTVLATAISRLNREGDFDHPVLDAPGWWRRDISPAEGRRSIFLTGFGRMASVIGECCALRRLRVLAIGSHDVLEHKWGDAGAWALIRVDEPAHSSGKAVRLHAEYATGGMLTLNVPADVEWRPAANSFLDLLVDQATGDLHLASAGDHNQYVLETGARAGSARP